MNKFNLTPIENEGKRVLTTAQIAESYETSTKTIADNFGNNRKRYIEGKHFYCLTGDELKAFKNQSENFGVVDKRASSLYLWTEKGALLHAKSLNTDKAWEVYDLLVENYFRQRIQNNVDSYMIDDPVKRAERWIEEQKEKQQLLTTVAVQEQQIQELKPKASYYDLVLNCSDLLSTSVIAKDYGKSAKWLNAYLHEHGIQFKQGNIWLLYQKYAERGYTSTKTHNVNGNDGQQHPKVHTYWTQKGRLFIYDLLKSNGIYPIVERNAA